MECCRSTFYYQERNISHIKSQSIAANLADFPHISPSISLWHSVCPAAGCCHCCGGALGEQHSLSSGFPWMLVPAELPFGIAGCTGNAPLCTSSSGRAGLGTLHQPQAGGQSLQLWLQLFRSIADPPAAVGKGGFKKCPSSQHSVSFLPENFSGDAFLLV